MLRSKSFDLAQRTSPGESLFQERNFDQSFADWFSNWEKQKTSSRKLEPRIIEKLIENLEDFTFGGQKVGYSSASNDEQHPERWAWMSDELDSCDFWSSLEQDQNFSVEG